MGSGASKKDCRSETSTEGDFNGKRVEVPPLRSRLRTHLGKQKVTLLEKRRGGEVFLGGEFGGCIFGRDWPNMSQKYHLDIGEARKS